MHANRSGSDRHLGLPSTDQSTPGKDGCRSGNYWCYTCCQTVSSNAKNACFNQDLTDLFKALGIVCAAGHSIEILWNDRVISIWQLETIQWLVAVVTRSRCHREAHLGFRRFPVVPDSAGLPQ